MKKNIFISIIFLLFAGIEFILLTHINKKKIDNSYNNGKVDGFAEGYDKAEWVFMKCRNM